MKANVLRELMKRAWAMVKNCKMSMSEAMKQAWKAIKVKVAMSKGIAKFSFRKADGSVRKAEGTTCLGNIPTEKQPKDNGKPASPKVITFFDTIKQEWRCFKPETLIAIG